MNEVTGRQVLLNGTVYSVDEEDPCWHAARWWAEQLEHYPTHDNGELVQSMMATAASERQALVESGRIDLFQLVLWRILVTDFEDSLQMAREQGNPLLGQYHRTISVDYDPDRRLAEAGKEAGISLFLRLPFKTVMWVNPGCVSVAKGYGASQSVAWEPGDKVEFPRHRRS